MNIVCLINSSLDQNLTNKLYNNALFFMRSSNPQKRMQRKNRNHLEIITHCHIYLIKMYHVYLIYQVS